MTRTTGHVTAVLGVLALAGVSLAMAASPALGRPHPAYSRADLKSVMARMRSAQPWAKVTGPLLSQWYVDTRADRVVVGLTNITPAARIAARQTFGGAVALTVAPPNVFAVGHGVAHGIVTSPRVNNATGTRINDNKPFEGGDEIISYWKVGPNEFDYVACTSSFAVTNTVGGASAMLSAGHCQKDSKSSNWYSGHVTNHVLNVGQKEGVQGNVVAGGKSDAMTVTQNIKVPTTYLPSDFVDSDTSHTVYPVDGQGSFAKGEKICTDGVISGAAICGPKITQTNMCVKFSGGLSVCNLAEATYSGPFCIQGDSGGPAYVDLGRVIPALGTIEGFTSGENNCFINRLGPALRAVSATLDITGGRGEKEPQ